MESKNNYHKEKSLDLNNLETKITKKDKELLYKKLELTKQQELLFISIIILLFISAISLFFMFTFSIYEYCDVFFVDNSLINSIHNHLK